MLFNTLMSLTQMKKEDVKMFGKEQVDVPRIGKVAIMTIFFSCVFFLSPAEGSSF